PNREVGRLQAILLSFSLTGRPVIHLNISPPSKAQAEAAGGAGVADTLALDGWVALDPIHAAKLVSAQLAAYVPRSRKLLALLGALAIGGVAVAGIATIPGPLLSNWAVTREQCGNFLVVEQCVSTQSPKVDARSLRTKLEHRLGRSWDLTEVDDRLGARTQVSAPARELVISFLMSFEFRELPQDMKSRVERVGSKPIECRGMEIVFATITTDYRVKGNKSIEVNACKEPGVVKDINTARSTLEEAVLEEIRP
ncbi:MAG TPA: hypothetical protein VKT78_08230, partial [Fimbriimonadaceae bacterium]|nr:hypothetical protein [Fimbriimonadaceae bacterium]